MEQEKREQEGVENQDVQDAHAVPEEETVKEAAGKCEGKEPEEPETGEETEACESSGEDPEEGESPETPEEPEDPEKEGESGKSFFKKKKKEDKKDVRIAELEDRVKRQLAEFENFRNRTEKEKSHMYEVGARDIIEKILPVVDNFERGLAAVTEDQKSNPFAEGMDKIYKQLMTTLTELGVKPIEAVGQEFDPNYHNAVMHVEDEEQEENIVVEEFQKGYLYRETVIRHSMVKVAN